MADWYYGKRNRWYVWVDGRKILRARWVMEQAIGRPLQAGEVVHHINRDSADDRVENLKLYASNAEHLRDAHGDTPPPKWAGKIGGRPRTYTAEQEAEALRLHEAGLSLYEIAKQMGLPYHSTAQHLVNRAKGRPRRH